MMTFTGTNPGESITRATGTMGHVNQQAMFHTLITFPLIVFLMVRNWLWRWVGRAVMAASFCAILLTFSRTAWISCVLAAAVIVLVAWRYGRISRGQWLSLCGGFLLVSILASAFAPLIVDRLFTGDDGASASRIRMATLAVSHIADHPLTGVGPGNFINARLDEFPAQWASGVWLPRGRSYYPRNLAGLELYDVEIAGRWYYFPGVVHNTFLVVSAELGLVGLGLFLWFEWRVFKAALKVLRSRDALVWWAGLGLLSAFIATQTEFMFDLFYDDKTVAVPIFVDALLLAAVRIAVRTDSGGEAR
jgi:O-antigen ligase